MVLDFKVKKREASGDDSLFHFKIFCANIFCQKKDNAYICRNYKTMKHLTYLIFLMILFSCSPHKPNWDLGESETKYSALLGIYEIEDSIYLCQIKNPWQIDKTLAQYLLLPKEISDFETKKTKLEKKYEECTILISPLEKITLTSSCHGYVLEQIDALKNISVFCDADYVVYDKVKNKIMTGEIVNGGNSMNPSIEIILSRGCDAIYVSPFENTSQSFGSTLPIPIIYCADYMETSPLGRAEWIRFFGLLVNKTQEADSLFGVIEKNYNDIAKEIKDNCNSSKKKTLLAELPYQSTWYVPGGKSSMGILYKDAGYKYQWEDDTHSGSLALSPEAVLAKAKDSDVWFFKYYSDHILTKDEFLGQDSYFGQFDAVKNNEVYGCNTMMTDFYDVTPFRPDILLDELKNSGGRYFHKIK